jgi:hypothetical protein
VGGGGAAWLGLSSFTVNSLQVFLLIIHVEIIKVFPFESAPLKKHAINLFVSVKGKLCVSVCAFFLTRVLEKLKENFSRDESDFLCFLARITTTAGFRILN